MHMNLTGSNLLTKQSLLLLFPCRRAGASGFTVTQVGAYLQKSHPKHKYLMQRNTYTHTNIYTHVNANQWESNRFLWNRWRNARMQNPIRIWPPVLLMVPKCCWFTALSSGKQNTVLNAAIYLRKGGQAPLYSSPLTRQPLYSGKQEGKIQPDAGGCYCSWKSFFLPTLPQSSHLWQGTMDTTLVVQLGCWHTKKGNQLMFVELLQLSGDWRHACWYYIEVSALSLFQHLKRC